jgi:hypothetical protein
MIRGVVAAALAAIALVAAGCSAGAPKAPPGTATTAAQAAAAKAPTPHYITDKELASYKSTSPEHAILEFWQAVQNKNLLLAYDGLAKDFKKEFAGTLPRFSRFVSADFPHWLTPPKFLFTQIHGSTAEVAISYLPQGFAVSDTDRSTVTLVREGGKWKIAYLFYLANRLRGQ